MLLAILLDASSADPIGEVQHPGEVTKSRINLGGSDPCHQFSVIPAQAGIQYSTAGSMV
jgi:hypothetical protein